METALYAPEGGYYARPRSPVGFSSDFYTAPQLHPIFGATVGRHVASILRPLVHASPLTVVELGPGNGELARSVIEELGRSFPRGPEIEYVLVERSEARGSASLDQARTGAAGTMVRPRRSPALHEEGPFVGVVLAHEFWDAQPARRFRWNGQDWEELGVRWESGHWVHASRSLPSVARPAGLPPRSEAGSVFECSPRAEGTVREVADHLVSGRAIFIDYGSEEEELLRTHRFGTLTAIRQHAVLDSVIDRPGEVDLSAYVNFSRLKLAAQRAGLEVVGDQGQAEALIAWGLEEMKSRWEAQSDPTETLRLHLAIKSLLFGFERFRAIELAPARAAPT